MRITSFPAGPWQANCYVVSVDGRSCVVVDPGVDAADRVRAIVADADLRVEGVLLTHGHIDHVACAAAVADHFGVPAWLHEADVELLDPEVAGRGLVPDARALLEQFGIDLGRPRRLHTLTGGESIDVAGATFDVVHAPGHRPGCVMYRLALPDASPQPTRPTDVVFSGDVVFAGSIGRTDLPGGDHAVMLETLRTVVLGLPDAATVLPGHGGQTTVDRERATNPYLQPSFLG